MKNKLKILAVNLVTTIRMVGIFALAPIYLLYGGAALGLTNISCFLTDFIDGKMARKLNASTFFGSLYDGLADKAFLAANFAIICSITPIALIPVGLELGIMGVQYAKYKKNLNVQSNIIGKAKMWVAGVAMTLSNFLIDVESLQFLGHNIISKISSVSNSSLVGTTLIPVIMAEVATLISYIMECFKQEKVKENKDHQVNDQSLDMPQEDEKSKTVERTLENIAYEKEQIRNKQEELLTYKKMLFDPDFYAEHKNEQGLKLLREKMKLSNVK